jgi:PAS domain-containing protein
MTRTAMPERDGARTNSNQRKETSMSTGESKLTIADPAIASAAIAAAGDAIVTTDGHGWITSWNRAAELLLGISAEQAIGLTLALIIPEALRARHAACFRAAMGSGRLGHAGQPARRGHDAWRRCPAAGDNARPGGRAAPRRRQPRPIREPITE